MTIAFMCALLLEQYSSGPLSHIDLDSISMCDSGRCAVYWVKDDNCEEVKGPRVSYTKDPLQVPDSVEVSGVAFGPG